MLFLSQNLKESLLLLSAGALLANGLPSGSTKHSSSSRSYHIDGVGTFTNSAIYTFSDNVWPKDGLIATDNEGIRDQNHGAPYNHIFLASNVFVKDGLLQVKVPGGQTPSTQTGTNITASNAVKSGEVFTKENSILYASVRTCATFSTVPGTVQGTFFYKSDTQEIDIEYLSDPSSKANTGGQPAVHFTNQPTNGGSSTTGLTAPPANIDTVFHEYRIDWTPSATKYYLNGVLQQTNTKNVPSIPGTWLWNNWANGDIQWSVGPPKQDSIMKIRKIEMYYNTTSS